MALQKQVGSYEVERVVGKGSFGKAVLVKDSRGDKFILKLINTARMGTEEVEEARREIEVLTKLVKAPFIVSYKDAFISNYEHVPHLCIVMEYCEGGDLGNLIQERRRLGRFFSEMTLRTWTLQLTLALDFMHKKKILHRDLKPANVFLDKENYIRVGDLGLSKVLEFTLQQAKTQCGTPAFMAPELCQGCSTISITPLYWLTDTFMQERLRRTPTTFRLLCIRMKQQHWHQQFTMCHLLRRRRKRF
eukprot:XP_028340498.1 serine/threonine-protein kinase Nek1-like [Physeter catodon]